MSENAERPARSGRESGKKERPTASSARSRPRIGQEGAADRLERAFPAADQARRRRTPFTQAQKLTFTQALKHHLLKRSSLISPGKNPDLLLHRKVV